MIVKARHIPKSELQSGDIEIKQMRKSNYLWYDLRDYRYEKTV